MRTKNLLILIVLTAVVVLAGIWLQRDRSISKEAVDFGLLVPELKEGINNVSTIRVIEPGNKPRMTINKTDKGWVVEEKDDYPANVGKIRDLLIRLSLSRIIEKKTSDPNLYSRLGVEDIDVNAGHAYGKLLKLEGMEKPVQILIGNSPVDTGNANYVRRVGEKTSWLVNDVFYIDEKILNWLDRSVIDVSPERVRNIYILHEDGDDVALIRMAPDDFGFALQGVPQGREQASGFLGNSIASAIAGLSFEDVMPASKFDISENSGITTQFETYDGMVIDASLFTHVGTNYVHFTVHSDAMVRKEIELGEEALSFEQVEKQALSLNEKLSPWVYEIPGIAYESLSKTLEDFLEEPDDDAVPDDEADVEATTEEAP